MTLTSRLDAIDDPMRVFLHERFPNTRPMIGDIRLATADKATIRPDVSVPWSLLGHAIDLRIRGYFQPVTSGLLPISELRPLWGDHGIKSYSFVLWSLLDEQAEAIGPVGRRLNQADEEWLCRYCILMAMFEVINRSGVAPSELARLDPVSSSTDAFLAGIPQPWVDDLRQLSWAFYEASADFLHQPVTIAPDFAGSDDVGGADGDIVLDGCLLEIKSAVNFKKSRPDWIYQLLGYVLLDYRDAHHIDSVGFYLARQATYIRWPLDTFLSTLAGGSVPPLAHLRKELRRIARVESQ